MNLIFLMGKVVFISNLTLSLSTLKPGNYTSLLIIHPKKANCWGHTMKKVNLLFDHYNKAILKDQIISQSQNERGSSC